MKSGGFYVNGGKGGKFLCRFEGLVVDEFSRSVFVDTHVLILRDKIEQNRVKQREKQSGK